MEQILELRKNLSTILENTASDQVYLVCQESFFDTIVYANLAQALADEQPGILTFAVAGLTRLLERGHFVPPPSSETILQAYRTGNPPIFSAC